jgi:hypothetical protein
MGTSYFVRPNYTAAAVRVEAPSVNFMNDERALSNFEEITGLNDKMGII